MVSLDKLRAERLAALIRKMHKEGHSPATSTNYSFLNSREPFSVAVSRSGRDKGLFQADDFLLVNARGTALAGYEDMRPSAETLLHTQLYAYNRDIEFVLHSHESNTAVLSRYYVQAGYPSIEFSGYEILKALGSISTHEVSVSLPIFANTQDIPVLAEQLTRYFEKKALDPQAWAYLIEGHGLYTWGRSFEEAKRHIEAWTYLLDCRYRELLLELVRKY